MPRFRWFVSGAITLAAVLALGVILLVKTQTAGFSTRVEPSGFERLVARRLRTMAVPLSAREIQNPEPDSPETQSEARAHWADHCAGCHSNNGSGDVEMGKHLYPRAPDMRQAETQNMTDGELFYVIQNGIRFTGMPAWGNGTSHDNKDSWKLVRFIRHLPQLTAAEEQEMRELNPKSGSEWKEEQDEKDFLNGGNTNEPSHHQHE